VALTLDVAVLRLADTAPWTSKLASPVYARVNREQTGRLLDCEAVGYPLMQRDPIKKTRDTAELHGTIYRTDEAESGRLLMREPIVGSGDVPDPSDADPATGGKPDHLSPWDGFSGALVFYRGRAIGVVVEHHPRQGDSALRAVAFDTIAKKATTDASARRVAEMLGLSTEEMLPWATPTSSKVSPLPFAASQHNAVSRAVEHVELTGPPPIYPSCQNDVGKWLVKLADWTDDISSLVSEIEGIAHFVNNNDPTARFIQAIDDCQEIIQEVVDSLADDEVARRDTDSLKSAADDLWDRILQLVPLSMKR
jgi:hypothetical protein